MINMNDALKLISDRRGDAIVLPTMTGGTAWGRVTDNVVLDLPVSGAMGKAASIGLGVSLAMPDRKVIVIDGDGSLLMNLGALVTVAGKKPANLYHFVMHNDVYSVTGGQPVPNADGFNFAEIAEGSGYASAYEFDNIEDFAMRLDEILSSPGPVLVSLRSEPEVENTPIQMRVRTVKRTPDAIRDMMAHLGTN